MILIVHSNVVSIVEQVLLEMVLTNDLVTVDVCGEIIPLVTVIFHRAETLSGVRDTADKPDWIPFQHTVANHGGRC